MPSVMLLLTEATNSKWVENGSVCESIVWPRMLTMLFSNDC